MEGLPCLVSGLRLVWQLTSLPRTRVYFSIKHPFPNGSLTTLETGTTRLLRHGSLKRGKRIVRTTAIEPGVRAPNHLSKIQPNPQSQEPPPDRSNPTRRYRKLANELGARASEHYRHWSVDPCACSPVHGLCAMCHGSCYEDKGPWPPLLTQKHPLNLGLNI